MRLAITALCLGLTAAGTAAAQTPAQIVACSKFPGDFDRLACYDRLADQAAAAIAAGDAPGQPPAATPPAGQWQIETRTSDFADTTDVFLSVQSEEPVACGFMGTARIRLFLRCMENTTAMLLDTHCHVASGFGGYGTVEYRIDDRPSQKRSFEESTDNRALGLWSGRRSIPLIKSMLGADSLLVRFTPFNESPVTARFPITGLDEAIAPLRENCHW